MGKGRCANGVLGQVSFIAPCTIALLCFASPGWATSILLPQETNVALLGAADLGNTGFAPVAAKAGAPGNAPATGSSGLFGTLADDSPAGVFGAARRGNASGLRGDSQLAAAIASLGSIESDTLNGEELTLVPGLSSSAFGANNLTGASMPLSLGDPNASSAVELPSSQFSSPDSPVNIIDVASDGGAALDWNIGSSAVADGIAFVAGGGLPGGISAAADVPEPATLLLLGGGLLIAGAKRRKTQRGLRIG
jgi:PEP-CTERM motif